MPEEINYELSFIENSSTNRNSIKRYIINHELLPYECSRCKNTGSWQGEIMTLHLDHINGINNDNRIENLRFLCPNCHSLTDSYNGKNKSHFPNVTVTEEQVINALQKTPNVRQAALQLGLNPQGASHTRISLIKRKHHIEQGPASEYKIKNLKYCVCGAIIGEKYDQCQACAHEKQRVVERPSREELKDMIKTKTFVELGRQFGVTDNAIRKWCDFYSLPRKKQTINMYSQEDWEKI